MGKELNLLDLLIVLLKHKWTVIIHFVLISIIALVYALALPKWYKSEVVFMPKGRSGTGLFSIMGDILSSDIIGGSALSKRQYKALLYSRELREELIKKYNLIEVYKLTKAINPMDQTLNKLSKIITIEEVEEGGLGITDVVSITVSVIDKDPNRASNMANSLFALLEEKSIELNRNEFNSITHFLIEKINECNTKLDSSQNKLKQFQLNHHIYDIPQQVTMVLQAISVMKAELLSMDNKIIYLNNIHSAGYDEIQILKKKKAALEQKLSEMENTQKDNVYLGLRHSLNLSNAFSDLYTEVQTYNQLRLLLNQQLEQSKIRQSKDFSPIYLIDPARPAEYKYKPKRSLVMLVIVFIYMTLLTAFLLLWDHYKNLKNNNPDKLEKINLLLKHIKSK